MRRIVYYVAISLDGFISGKKGDISGFVSAGNGVDQYREDLKAFDTVIMGRNTYEFGYDYGLKPGQLGYPHMDHYIFSNTLQFETQDPKLEVKAIQLNHIRSLKEQEGSDIYLCGGGEFAGWLLDNQQIDLLKIKLNPFVQGEGVRLFGDSKGYYRLELLECNQYDQGLQIMSYKVHY